MIYPLAVLWIAERDVLQTKDGGIIYWSLPMRDLCSCERISFMRRRSTTYKEKIWCDKNGLMMTLLGS